MFGEGCDDFSKIKENEKCSLHSQPAISCCNRDGKSHETKEMLPDGAKLEESIQQVRDLISDKTNPQVYNLNVLSRKDVGVLGEEDVLSFNLCIDQQEQDPAVLSDRPRKETDCRVLSCQQKTRNLTANADVPMVQCQDQVTSLDAVEGLGEGQFGSNEVGKGWLGSKGTLCPDQESKDSLLEVFFTKQADIGYVKTSSMIQQRHAICTFSNTSLTFDQSKLVTKPLGDGINIAREKESSPDRMVEARLGTLDIPQNITHRENEGFLHLKGVDIKGHNSESNSDCTTGLYRQEPIAKRPNEESKRIKNGLAEEAWLEVVGEASFQREHGQCAQLPRVQSLNLIRSDGRFSDNVLCSPSINLPKNDDLLLKNFLKRNPCLVSNIGILFDSKPRTVLCEHDGIIETFYEDTDKNCVWHTDEDFSIMMSTDTLQKKRFLHPIPFEQEKEKKDGDVPAGGDEEGWHTHNEGMFHQRPVVVWQGDSGKELPGENLGKIGSLGELGTRLGYDVLNGECPQDPTLFWHADDAAEAQIKGNPVYSNHFVAQPQRNAATVSQSSRLEKGHGREVMQAARENAWGYCGAPPMVARHQDTPEPPEMEASWLKVDEEIYFKMNNWPSGTHRCEIHQSTGSCCRQCVYEPTDKSAWAKTVPANCQKFLRDEEWSLNDLVITLESIRNYESPVTSGSRLPSNDDAAKDVERLGEGLNRKLDETNSNKGGDCVISVSEYESNPLNRNDGASRIKESFSGDSDGTRQRSVLTTSPFDNSDSVRWFAVDGEVSLKAEPWLASVFWPEASNSPTGVSTVSDVKEWKASSQRSDTGDRSHGIFNTPTGKSVIMQQQTPKGKGGGQGQNRQGPSQKPKVFDPYWSEDKVGHGIKKGLLIVGPIRINAKNYKEAYVPQPDGLADVFIDDLEDRNRALNSDEVVVLPYSLEKWRVNVEEFEEHRKNRPQTNQAAANQSSGAKGQDCESEDSGPDVIIESDNSDENPGNDNKEGGGGRKISQDQGQKVNSSHLEASFQQFSISQGSTPVNQKQRSANQMPRQRQTSDLKNFKCLTVAQMRLKYSHDPLAVELFGPSLEDMVTPVSVGTSFVARFLQVTGRVVFIYERKHSRVASGHIKHMSDKNKKLALFAPLDSRVPRIIIPMSDCPKDFGDRPDDFTSTLYIARITSWEDNSKMPKGNLARSIGEAGQVEPETEAMLIEMDVDDSPFNDKVLACLPQDLPWTIPEKEIASRKDLRSSCIFTIDPSTARDLDDAVSCEELGDGNYKVGVHIADVSYFVTEGTELDKAASQRATSVYLVQKVVAMLPRLLCEELCSLNPDQDRLAFSVEWIINEEGEICEEWYGRTIIRSCVKLSYDHAQGFIEQPEKDWTAQELPAISKPFLAKDIVKRVLTLNKIAVALRKQRYDNGALRLDQVKLSYSLNKETGLPNGTFVYQQKDSNRLIEEFMLLANMAVAHRIQHCFPETAVLRRHPAPQNKPLQALEELCESLGLELNTSTAGTVQESLRRYYAEDEYSLARVQVLVALISKPMQNARYFCTGTLPDQSMYHHYALNVPLYTHFTSPIRRYADVMVHRLLSAAQGYSSPPTASVQELQKKASHCNDKKFNAKIASDRSSDMYFALYVKEVGPMEANGMVMAVLDKSFDVLILAYGVTKRVYLENLPLFQSSYAKRHKSPELTLEWVADDTCHHKTHHLISLFTMVECVIYPNKEPLKWSCVIRRPKEDIKFVSENSKS